MSARVFLATIHSFCFNLLKMEGVAFEILTGKDQIRFIRDVIKHLKYKDLAIGMVLREISLAKNNLIVISEFRDLYTGDKTMLKVADVFELYDRRKASKMLMDFDDLLVNAYQLLKSDDTVRQKYREIFRHLLVDEFQDSNPIQFELMKLLLPSDNGNDSSFWICGDDAQSIYGFTGASVGNILNFKSMFPEFDYVPRHQGNQKLTRITVSFFVLKVNLVPCLSPIL
jgi:DNA helicase-2/ATP-dependent DNA helicase PcrA